MNIKELKDHCEENISKNIKSEEHKLILELIEDKTQKKIKKDIKRLYNALDDLISDEIDIYVDDTKFINLVAELHSYILYESKSKMFKDIQDEFNYKISLKKLYDKIRNKEIK